MVRGIVIGATYNLMRLSRPARSHVPRAVRNIAFVPQMLDLRGADCIATKQAEPYRKFFHM